MIVEEEFFALLDHYYDNSLTKTLYLFHKTAWRRNSWDVRPGQALNMGQAGYRATMTGGKDFLAVLFGVNENLNKFKWNGSAWIDEFVPGYSTAFAGVSQIGGTNNYFVIHNGQYNPDQIAFHFIDELHGWRISQVNSSLSFDTPLNTHSNWFNSNSFATVFAPNNPEFIYVWDEEFTSTAFIRNDGLGLLDDQSRVFIINNSLLGTSNYPYGNPSRLARFTGAGFQNGWYFASLGGTGSTVYSFGDDIVLHKTGPGTIERIDFNPNTLSWSGLIYLGESHSTSSFPRMANHYYLLGYDIYYRLWPGIWDYIYTLPSPPDAYSNNIYDGSLANSTRNYTVYQSINGTTSTFFLPIKNGQAQAPPIRLANQQVLHYSSRQQVSNLVGPNAFVTWPQNIVDFKDATQLNLYRVINGAVTGQQADYPVTKLEIYDGYQSLYTHYVYETGTAVYDPSGSIAQYNEVQVIPGSVDGIATPYGYTKQYFINGLPAEVTHAPYPPNDAYTNARDYYSVLTGLPYLTKNFNNTGLEVSSTTQYWKVITMPLGSKAQGFYSRLMKETSTIDGVEKIVKNTYNTLGLTTETKTDNYNWDGNLDTHTQTFKYWHEAYDPSLTFNLLTPVIQTTTKTNATTTSVSATTWKEWFTGKWAPHKSYQWNGSGSSSFDFANWSGAGEPSSDWLKTSEIATMITEGAVLQAKDVDGVYQSTLYDYPKLRPIAAFSNARISQAGVGDEASFINFEYGSATSNVRDNDYWGFPPFNLISSIAHTGRKSCGLNADNNASVPVYGPTRDFRPPDLKGQQRRYVLSGWVRTQAGFGANKGQLIIHSKQDTDADNTVYPNVTGALIIVSFSDTQGNGNM